MAFIDLKLTPKRVKRLMNFYPPYMGAGIRCRGVSDDFREIDIEMKLRWFNRNFVGTHFGGSLFSMCDPWFMFMMLQNLGRDFIVWDQSANIRFLKPGKGTMLAEFRITQSQIDRAIEETAGGERYRPEFHMQVTDEEGEPVAEITKQLYIRLKRAPQAS